MTTSQEKQIENKLHNICDYVVKKEFNQHIGLMSGMIGEIIFLAYYSRHFKNNDIADSIKPRLEYVLNKINSGDNYPTFAGGICGINWALEHLNKYEFIDYDINELYDSSDEFLKEWMINYILNSNYDFLHGALGIANYFSERNSEKTNMYINEFISILEPKCDKFKDIDALGVQSTIYSTGTPFKAYNFSLSHGMTSILYFLQKCENKLQLNDNGKSSQIFNGILNFFKHHKNDISKYNSYYPTWIDGENSIKNARIAWCYGDLGIGSIFLNISRQNQSESYKEHGVSLINNTLNRVNPEKEIILDAAICHGSSGLSLLYENAYHLTNNLDYLKQSDYWLNHCLNEDKYLDGACGYKSYMGVKTGWSTETGLLEGISGIGLVLLSKLNKENCHWKECLML